jgi:hypothetical protein
MLEKVGMEPFATTQKKQKQAVKAIGTSAQQMKHIPRDR